MSQVPRFALSGIPNDEAGRAFIKQLRRYCNYGRYTVAVRGSGPRAAIAKAEGLRPTTYQQDLPLAKAATLRIYFNDKFEAEAYMRHLRIIRELREENGQLVHNVQQAQQVTNSVAAECTRKCNEAFKRGHDAGAARFSRLPRWVQRTITFIYGG